MLVNLALSINYLASFLDFLTAFFSLALRTGFFFFSLLLFCSLLMGILQAVEKIVVI